MQDDHEPGKNQPKPDTDSGLEASIAKEFGQYQGQVYAGIRREFSALVDLGLARASEAEGVIEARRQQYKSLDFNGQVGELTNNFIYLWPGGYRRQSIEQSGQDSATGSAEHQADLELIQDLDASISEAGFTGSESPFDEKG